MDKSVDNHLGNQEYIAVGKVECMLHQGSKSVDIQCCNPVGIPVEDKFLLPIRTKHILEQLSTRTSKRLVEMFPSSKIQCKPTPGHKFRVEVLHGQ